MTKKALITGVTGQDGAYLAQFLLEKGYNVYGAYRRCSTPNFWRLEELGIKDRVNLVCVEISDEASVLQAVRTIEPDEIYNLAAQSFVEASFSQPIYTGDVDGLSVTRILDSIRLTNKKIKFYQASTSEMFGKVQCVPQSEETPFYPRSPYGVAKLYGHWITKNYRESYDIFASSGILFNHESPLRGFEFVTRKITIGLANIKHSRQNILEVGNMDAQRDWGFAGDYVKGMWKILQHKEADDFVLATGETHTVREFITLAAPYYGFDIEWQGEGKDEIGVNKKDGKRIVAVNPVFYRPAEVDLLLGTAKKAEKVLGWKSETSFPQLVEMMAKADLARAAKGQL